MKFQYPITATVLALFSICPAVSSATPGEDAFLELIGREKDGITLPLWPGDGTPPNVARKSPPESVESPREGMPAIRDVSIPSLVFLRHPENEGSQGVTFVYAPGGGYGVLGLSAAVDIYKWANAIGANCAMLKYRVPKAPDDPGRQIPLSDAQRAIRILRSQAVDLQVDPGKIVIIGASAGGHLAFNLCNNHEKETYKPIDDTDKSSARPDAAILLYPAYLTNPIMSLDEDPHLDLENLSPERTSPILMTVTRPDKFTWGAIHTMSRLGKAKVPAELHIYADGGHSGAFNKYPLLDFARPAARFLKDKSILTEKMQRRSDEWIASVERKFVTPVAPSPQKAEPSIPGLKKDQQSTGDKALAALREPAPAIIPLWPGDGTRDDDPTNDLEEVLPKRSDGFVRVTSVSRPTLHFWPAKNPDGRAVIIFPGGGYNGLATQHEGTEIAAWLNNLGITAFVTKYRVPRRQGMEKHAVALQDAQRAIRIVRSRAGEYGIDPAQVGVMGFSAGGNLAALTIHKASHPSYEPIDEIDKAKLLPDFAMLVYPAYLTADRNGPELDPIFTGLENRNAYPPIFNAVAADDPFAPSSLYYLLHLHKQRVPGELHVYEKGGHGKGIQERGYPFSQWTKAAERWLTDLKRGTTQIYVPRDFRLKADQ